MKIFDIGSRSLVLNNSVSLGCVGGARRQNPSGRDPKQTGFHVQGSSYAYVMDVDAASERNVPRCLFWRGDADNSESLRVYRAALTQADADAAKRLMEALQKKNAISSVSAYRKTSASRRV